MGDGLVPLLLALVLLGVQTADASPSIVGQGTPGVSGAPPGAGTGPPVGIGQQGSTAAAPTASRDLEAATRTLAAQLRCPVCQGLSIQDSPAELAVEMKAVVREQLAAGRSADEIKAYFIGKYGEWVLLEPEASGFNLVVYLLPVLGVLAGGLLIWRAVRRWTAGAEPAPHAVDEG